MQEPLPQLHQLPPMPVGRKPRIGAVPVSGLLTIPQVAKMLGLAPPTVYLRIRDCRFHPIRHGRNVFIHPDEVENELQRIQQFHVAKPGRILQRVPIDSAAPERKEFKTSAPSAPPPPVSASVPSSSYSSLSSSDLEPPTQYTGEQAARAIGLFRQGKGQLEIVEEMNVGFELARYFWKCYVEAQPSWLLPPKHLAQIRALIAWQEDPPSPENFQKALQRFIAQQIERETSASVERQIGGEELSVDEKIALDEADAEVAARAAMRAKAIAADAAATAKPIAPAAPSATAAPTDFQGR